ncbi:unnamed protein product [Kuraishia capsulata CBS 1993]|uniref:Complex I-B15 n=1 Tax=Kuraishia capsulata CBS 1993 TaxID=1382522 RepID=W6MKR3_9ASCO|nr:uncharacterized protein KUCA_T00001311001 [Kuraishia capsulata CBS 1993]CDK25342.1 unnamed protein product [Kuraishia capsulata CBS 1993]
MAGHGPHLLKSDKGFIRFNELRDGLSNFYRFNGKALKHTTMFFVIIPGLLGYAALKYEGRIDLHARRRKEPLFEEYVPRK